MQELLLDEALGRHQRAAHGNGGARPAGPEKGFF